ncbi:uncharacterized protein IL334_000546 [Kwoniella shivajii]|uniref:polynucleotide adenylyltransferase n=1 Tax=Kwoniella shivajii TaxID=564305 RepID=A0ABZ1CPF5_9TREE|nr:hypothetical protein IL334_000546 [Kwoniella shivajii]
MAQATDFSEGADFISFGFSPPLPENQAAEAGPSRIHPSLPSKPSTSTTSDTNTNTDSNRKGKRKASDAEPSTSVNSESSKEKKSKKQKKGKRDREKEKDKEKEKEKEKEKKKANGVNDTGPKNLKEERQAAERHAPWADLVNWEECKDPAEMLNEEINAFYKYVSPTKEEFEVRLFMIELITRNIMQLWPDAEVTPFGSWQTQLYLPQGDIDLVVSNKQFSESNKARLLSDMARAMRKARITDEVAIISRARVPIIKFVTNEGKLNVDISLNQVNGISAGNIINQYLDSLPGARQLILVVKSFLSQRSMNEVYTGGLGSYAVICLVISFLQVHPKLRRSELDPEENLGTLLIEFFELYGRNFNYQDVGLSIRKGGYYYLKSSRGWLRPNQSFLLSIEDPQDRDNDISSGSFGIRQVKNTLAGAYELLLMRLFERADILSGRRSGRNKQELDTDRLSILTGVMGITKETLKQREALQQLHAAGKLQRLLSIPQGANPKSYVTNYRPPPTLFTPRSRDRASRSSRANVPAPQDRRDGGVGAIIVDDDEVSDEDDDSDYESDTSDIGPDDTFAILNRNGTSSSSSSTSSSSAEDGEEEGEILELPGLRNKSRSLKSRAAAVEASYGGFSDNISEDEIEVLNSPPNKETDENENDESRYAISRKPKPRQPKPKTKTKSSKKEEDLMNDLYSVSDSDSDSDSDDSSIQAIDPPSKNKNEHKDRNAIKSKKEERRAFWASKGLGGSGGGGKDDDDWDGGADFVGLD